MSGKPIAIILPWQLHFGPQEPTSVDLCVNDFVRHSRFKDRTVVVCTPVDESFCDIATQFFERKNPASWRSGLNSIVACLERLDPAVVVVHQHVRTTRRLIKNMPGVPVLLHRHNFVKTDKGWFTRKFIIQRYGTLAGVIFVSETCRGHFDAHWPEINLPTHVVHNGLDFSEWTPRDVRDKIVLFAGRMRPGKGVLDMARALACVLPDFPDWTTCFLCTVAGKQPEYAAEVRAVLADIGPQARLLEDQPFAVVKDLSERAAISVVPSREEESFGRTALEAFAGGSALITSGAGGLAEVAGRDAIVEPDLSVAAQGAALRRLMGDDRLRSRLARRGQLRGKSLFDIRRVAASLDDIYAPFLGEDTMS